MTAGPAASPYAMNASRPPTPLGDLDLQIVPTKRRLITDQDHP
jgi:hypothetical protein